MSEQNNINGANAEKEIDLLQLAKDLWARKKTIIRFTSIGIIVGLVVAFSIPKEYHSGAELAPEFTSDKPGGLSSLGGLASMVGISAGGANAGGDAISATLYPDVVASIPFIAELFPIEINAEGGKLNTTLYEYMDEHQKLPWWKHVAKAPFKALGAAIKLFKPKEESNNNIVNIKALTEKQYEIYKSLKERISVSVDDKTMIISVKVKMQDAQVATDIANIVIDNLQTYISNYRTQKAKKDLEYAQMVFKEAKEKYYVAQQEYAKFEDENKNITSSRYRTEQERLRNDMNLTYSLYTNLASNLEQSRLKVQEQTPVYVTISPATRPTDESEPNKPITLIAFTFLAAFISVIYLINKDKLIKL